MPKPPPTSPTSDADLLGRDAEHVVRELVAQAGRRLAARAQRDAAGRGVEVRERGARLDRRRHQPLVDEVEADRVLAPRERRGRRGGVAVPRLRRRRCRSPPARPAARPARSRRRRRPPPAAARSARRSPRRRRAPASRVSATIAATASPTKRTVSTASTCCGGAARRASRPARLKSARLRQRLHAGARRDPRR